MGLWECAWARRRRARNKRIQPREREGVVREADVLLGPAPRAHQDGRIRRA